MRMKEIKRIGFLNLSGNWDFPVSLEKKLRKEFPANMFTYIKAGNNSKIFADRRHLIIVKDNGCFNSNEIVKAKEIIKNYKKINFVINPQIEEIDEIDYSYIKIV